MVVALFLGIFLGTSLGPLGVLVGFWWASWWHVGRGGSTALSRRGSVEPFWGGRSGRVLGLFWSRLGRSWAFWRSWGCLGPLLSWGRPGARGRFPEALLGRQASEAIRIYDSSFGSARFRTPGPCRWAPWGRPGNLLGASWGLLGTSWGLRGIRGPSWADTLGHPAVLLRRAREPPG